MYDLKETSNIQCMLIRADSWFCSALVLCDEMGSNHNENAFQLHIMLESIYSCNSFGAFSINLLKKEKVTHLS